MQRKNSLRGVWVLATAASLMFACVATGMAGELPKGSAPQASGALLALDQAARDGKYLFLFFWKQNDQQTQTMYQVFQTATSKMTAAANTSSVNITDPKEREIVARYGLSRAPMPLVMAVAPNGAITKGIPNSCTEKQLQEAFVSNGAAMCLKCLQDRKMVLLCVQSRSAESARSDFRGVREFAADPRFAASTDVVVVDSANRAEAGFLQSLQVRPGTTTGQVVLLSPPGQPVAKFVSGVTKEEIITRLTTAGSSCCPGGKCGPDGKCGPSPAR